MSRARPASLAVVTVVATLAMAACGNSSPGGASGGAPATDSAGLTTITVGTVASADNAPAYLADKVGIFAEHGLKVTFQQAQGGAAVVPAVVSGQFQFGPNNVVSELQAVSQGLGLRIVGPLSATTGDTEKDTAGILVPSGSAISSPKDLVGKKVANNSTANISEVGVREAVKADGGDPSKVQFVELAFPDMLAALQANRVDAAFMVEPFLSAAQAAGNKVISFPYATIGKDTGVAVWITSQSLVDKSPDVVKRFTEAVTEAQTYANAHPDEVRQVLGEFTKIDAATAEKMTLPSYPSELSKDSVEQWLTLGKEYGAVTAPVPADKLYYP